MSESMIDKGGNEVDDGKWDEKNVWGRRKEKRGREMIEAVVVVVVEEVEAGSFGVPHYANVYIKTIYINISIFSFSQAQMKKTYRTARSS